MARMAILNVFADTLFQLFEGPPLRRLGEQRAVNLLGRVAAGAADHDFVFLRVPFQEGAGADEKPAQDLGRHGDLEIWPCAVSLEQAIRTRNTTTVMGAPGIRSVVPCERMQGLIAGILLIAFCLPAHGQDPQATEIRGLPPRATPGDYQAHTQAGEITIGAEFAGHAVPTPQGPLSTEDYVVVETGVFGPPGARLKLSQEDFSLRINGRKTPLPSQPYALVFNSLKDPDYVPPDAAPSASKSKTSLTGGGGGGDSNAPPAPVRIPIEVQRAMQQRVQKAAMPEGDRALPLAGLVFFPYSGAAKGIRSIELIYTGPAGKAVFALRP